MIERDTPPTAAERDSRLRREAGYVIALGALMMVPIIIFAGFATDMGAWYAKGTQVQRASDAAALAGAPWMPNFNEARTAALAAAERNGYAHDPSGTGVTVDVQPGGTPRQIEVTITAPADIYFTGMVNDDAANRDLCLSDVCISRRAVGEYILSVPLGSPLPSFGNAGSPTACPILTGGQSAVCTGAGSPYDQTIGNPNVWGSISGPYTAKINGDPYSTKCINEQNGNDYNTACGSGGANPTYRDSGYLYAIEVPPSAVGETLTVDIFDGPHVERGSYPNIDTADRGGVHTAFELFRADGTVLDNTDNPTTAGTCTSGPGRQYWEGDTGPINTWNRLCSYTVGTAGRWLLRVTSSNLPERPTDAGNGWNQFAIRSTLSGSTPPRVYALEDMSMFNNPPLTTAGTNQALFYLAEVGTEHAGKVFAIDLFDPGDAGGSGNMDLNFLAPGLANSACRYRTQGTSTWTNANPCSIVTKSGSSSPYNGLWVEVEIDLPITYSCTTDCWWQVRYDFNIRPNDRTVWAARIKGDPVHLEE